MFRLFKAELKKIFLKPSIFVVTGLIILMLAVSTFIYKPDTRSEYKTTYPTYQSIKDYYNYFETSNATYTKKDSDRLIMVSENYVNSYVAGKDAIKELNDQWKAVEALFDTTPNEDYVSLYSAYETTSDEEQKASLKNDLEIKRDQLKSAIENFSNTYRSYSQNGSEIYFLVNTVTDDKIRNQHLDKILSIFDMASGRTDGDQYIISEFRSFGAFSKIFEDLKQLLPFTPSESLIAELKTTKIEDELEVVNENSPIVIARERLNAIDDKIFELYDAHKSDSESTPEDRAKMIEYMNKYYYTADYVYNLVDNSVKVSGLSKYTAMDITKFKNFTSSNFYDLKEKLARTKFLFNSETFGFEYADPFSVIQPSNTELSGFDYSYFALRLCTFFITIYIVVLAAGTIAGEQSAGTLKLLAIRPYSRNKLLSAKILATLSIGAILLFVSSIASLVVGAVTYGLNFTTILAVFNADVAFAINPLLLYLIAMFTMFIEITFYAMISIFISTVFKSNVAAVSISTLIFFVSLVINVIATNVPLLGLIPFVNVNFFKYFGSAFLDNSGGNNLIQMILTPSVFSGSTFWTSLILYTLTFVVVTIVTHLMFKKRDIK